MVTRIGVSEEFSCRTLANTIMANNKINLLFAIGFYIVFSQNNAYSAHSNSNFNRLEQKVKLSLPFPQFSS